MSHAHFFAKFFWDVDGSFFRDIALVMSRVFDRSLNIYTVVLVDEFCKSSWNQSKLISPFVWEGNRTVFTKCFATIHRAQHVASPAFTIIASLFSFYMKNKHNFEKIGRRLGCV
jgi:hypothetical protein